VKQYTVQPTGREKMFSANDIIVSKTDLKGVITYANETFLNIAGYTENEILGQPHSIIRHPDMPHCLFDLLWSTIKQGEEIFAYVKNMCKNGDHYWVFAHVTPTFNDSQQICGYHSNRRVPDRNRVKLFEEIYAELRAEERRHQDWRKGMEAASQLLMRKLSDRKMAYDEFVFSV
jgi:PAS domain S-box-containing protein